MFGYTLKVVYRINLKKNGEELLGYWQPDIQTIYLQKNTRKRPTSREVQEQAFLHEVVHAMLNNLGYDKLSANEKLVDQLASLIHQLLKYV